ncbi:MAG: hypothetical protein ACFFC7_00650 [Candidatus Hermodarchaeota archaeon]
MNREDILHCFRAYDIRGLYNSELTPEVFFDLGSALGAYLIDNNLAKGGVFVGGDFRTTSPNLSYSLIGGLSGTGVDVTFAGRPVSFGVCLFSGWYEKKAACAFITASHLQAKWNGLKLYHGDGVGFSEKRIKELAEYYVQKKTVSTSWKDVGAIEVAECENEYIEFMLDRFSIKRPIKIVIDCGNASTSLIAPKLFQSFDHFEVIELFTNPDPTFPNRDPEPNEESLKVLSKTVIENKADLGVGFDGDGDRAVLVDDKGRVLLGDQTGTILGRKMLEEKKGTVIANIECSSHIEHSMKDLASKIIRIPVGHTFLTLEARNHKDTVIGIESSGHIVLPWYYLFDDAILVPLKMAEILSIEKQKFSDLVDQIAPPLPKKSFPYSCDENIKFKVVEDLKTILSNKFDEVNTIDGVRVDLDGGWGLIRASNTSPVIRLTVEGETSQKFEEIKSLFEKELLQAIKQLS